jgi:hypothetical protein
VDAADPVPSIERDERLDARAGNYRPAQHAAVAELELATVPVLHEGVAAATHPRQLRVAM